MNSNDMPGEDAGWMAETARRILTPATGVWLAGFGVKRPPEGKLHDIWVKVLALGARGGKRAVMVTTDHQGMSRTIYESLYGLTKIKAPPGIRSHNTGSRISTLENALYCACIDQKIFYKGCTIY